MGWVLDFIDVFALGVPQYDYIPWLHIYPID